MRELDNDMTASTPRGVKIAVVILFGILPALTVILFRSAPIALGLALIAILADRRSRSSLTRVLKVPDPLELRIALAALLLLFLWALTSLAWTRDPAPAAGKLASVAALTGASFALAAMLGEVRMRAAMNVALVGCAIALVAMISELLGWTQLHRLVEPRAFLYDLNRTAALFAFMLPGIVVATLRGRVPLLLGLVVAAGMAACIIGAESQSAQLALIAGLAGGFIGISRRLALPLALLLSAGIILAPLIPRYVEPVTRLSNLAVVQEMHAEHRLAIWRGYSNLVGERPVRGYGFRSSRDLGMSGAIQSETVPLGLPPNTTHPHNAPLEIWIDLGLIGAILAAIALGAVAIIVRHLPSITDRAATAALTTGAAAFSATSNGLYQGWWIASVAIGALLLAQAVSRPAPMS